MGGRAREGIYKEKNQNLLHINQLIWDMRLQIWEFSFFISNYISFQKIPIFGSLPFSSKNHSGTRKKKTQNKTVHKGDRNSNKNILLTVDLY